MHVATVQTEGDLGDFEREMIVGVGLSISESAGLPGFSRTTTMAILDILYSSFS